MDRRIESIIEAVTELDEDFPKLDRYDLESRLCDLERGARALTECDVESLPGAIENLADAIHELYNEV